MGVESLEKWQREAGERARAEYDAIMEKAIADAQERKAKIRESMGLQREEDLFKQQKAAEEEVVKGNKLSNVAKPLSERMKKFQDEQAAKKAANAKQMDDIRETVDALEK